MNAQASSSVTATVSNIRLEVERETTPPVISNVAAGGITATNATITWNTNENSNTQVEYGPTTAYGQSTTLNSALVTFHSQGLSGLTAGTLYHYRVKSRDAAGNLAISGDFTFTTAPPPDNTPPVIYNISTGEHQHYFYGATQTLQVSAGDRLYAYVYLDPANTPSEVMLQWNDGTWEHRAYWGSNHIQWGTDGTASRRYIGPLPQTGGWMRLEVPASAVGLEDKTVQGLAFTLNGGRANWDNAGKTNGAGDTAWVDDALPAGATMGSDGGDSWTWVGASPSPYSGAVSTQSNIAAAGITATSATITWATDENSNSQVEYGTDQTYGHSTTLNPALVTSHSQVLSGLTPGTLYHYRVKSRDAAGNLAISADFTFTTVQTDTTPPTVTSFSPAAGATNVNANANVTVTFSEAMNPATVNGSTIELRDSSNALISATVSYNAASLTATLDPTASLAVGMTYTVKVRGGGTDPRVKDMAGNALASDVTWAFTRGLPANLSMAMIDPINRIGGAPGEDLLSRNYNWSLPLISLPGRAGLDLGLTLSLNSLVYTKTGAIINFDPYQGYPAPGFSLGFPEIRNAFLNTEANSQSYLLTMPSGRAVEFRPINANVYEAVDSSYMLLTHDPLNSVFILYTTNGTQCRFVDVTGSGDYKCVQIKDRNGNYITIGYGGMAEIRIVIDTLGRVFDFNYDEFNQLNSITQNWGGTTHTWATFAYGTQTIQTNFTGLTLSGTANGAQESVLMRVGLADGSVYSFEYNTYAQVKTIRRYAPNNSNPASFPGDYFQRAYTTYGLPDNASSAQTDCPRITSRTDWAYDWNPGVTSTYTADPGYAWGQVTFPDGAIYKEFFATAGWQRGLTTQSEHWSGGVRKKWTTIQWTQDNTSVVYKLNPRVTETVMNDDANNHRRTSVSYINFGLPSDVYEYDIDSTTILRHTHTDYNLSAVYTDKRIIGLLSAQFLYDGANNLFSKVDYQYDLGGEYQVHQGPPAQHDTANYGSGFVQGRGNLNKMRRWDVTDQYNASKASESETGYNTSGSVIFTRDPLDHQSNISYADSFSDGQNRNTYAYPTTMTDPDNFSSTVQYNYHFGAVTRTQDPKGAAVTRTYDEAGRLERTTNVVNGAYTRYVYWPHQREVETFTTINDLNPANEFRTVTSLDGHGRVRVTISDHPTSIGQYKGQYNVYDVMGRLAQQTNPTEVAANGVPVGDDEAGWVWTYHSYDWQGLPTLTTNQDGTTREVLYGGCGCAGGQVVVTRDEVGRRQKMTFDILGRLKTTQVLFIQPKNQPLDGSGAVYSTTTNTYNVRDQLTNVNVRDEASGVSQNTQMVYDGHGRLWKHRRPIETADTELLYNSDDTLFRKTDPRGVNATYSYNNRKMVTGVDYDEMPNTPSPPLPPYLPTSDVTFAYDEMGNRLWMDDGPGRTDYNFNSLGQLISETRHISALNRSYTISYEYNLGGQLKKITDPWNASITYGRDKSGGVTEVTGLGYANIGPLANQVISQFASNIKYRAWGAAKELTNGNISFQSIIAFNYDTRLRLTQFNGGGRVTTHQYYDDGRIQGVQDQHINNFNRSYSYDHAGRLITTSAGTDANPNLNPYSYNYQYDVWDNTTQRSGHYWSATAPNITGSYVNNRNTTMTYDQAGNITFPYAAGSVGAFWVYDSAGRLSLSAGARDGLLSEARLSYEYDGDGRRVGFTSFYQSFFPSYSTYNQHYQFFIRSSVLGGEVLAEIEASNSLAAFNDPMQYLSKSYVYLNGERLAYQNDMHLTPAEASASILGKEVRWIYREPVIQTESQSSPLFPNYEVFVDPTGSKVDIVDPATIPPPIPPINPPILDLHYYGDGDKDWPGGCVVDGQPTDCERAMKLLRSGAAQLLGNGAYQHNIIPTSRGTFIINVLPAGSVEGYNFYDTIVGFIQGDDDNKLLNGAKDSAPLRQSAKEYYDKRKKCIEEINKALAKMKGDGPKTLEEALENAKFVDLTDPQNARLNDISSALALTGKKSVSRNLGPLLSQPNSYAIAAYENEHLSRPTIFFGETFIYDTGEVSQTHIPAHEVLHTAFKKNHRELADMFGLKYEVDKDPNLGDLYTDLNARAAIDKWIYAGCDINAPGYGVNPSPVIRR